MTVSTFQTPEDQVIAVREDLASLLDEGVAPGHTVIVIDRPLKESPISTMTRIGRKKVTWMNRSYRNDSRDLQVTTIESFKGLEADVVLIVKGDLPGG